MYLLDTNIVSILEPKRRRGASAIVGWMEQNGSSLFLSAMTVAESESGILKLRRDGQIERADELAGFLAAVEVEFGERILPMDAGVAHGIARLEHRIWPRVIELADLIIAATADVHRLTVLTRNVRHFEPTGVQIIDPFTSLPPELG